MDIEHAKLILEEIEPICDKFTPKEKVTAATGLRMQLTENIDILPGMPFIVFKNNLQEIQEIFKKEFSDNLKTASHGIIVKADSLGSLEALLLMLEQNNIPVLKAGIGKINKTDIINAKANMEINELDAVILGFNVSSEEDAVDNNGKIKVITDEVIYKLIENLIKFRDEKRKEIEKKRLFGLSPLYKLKILKQYVFRNTNPAIFGIRVEVGKAVSGFPIINEKGEKVGKIKNLQSENKSVEEAHEGQELAISMPGINYERKIKDMNFLYSDITESQFRNFRKNKDLLSSREISLLQELAEIKRRNYSEWGM